LEIQSLVLANNVQAIASNAVRQPFANLAWKDFFWKAFSVFRIARSLNIRILIFKNVWTHAQIRNIEQISLESSFALKFVQPHSLEIVQNSALRPAVKGLMGIKKYGLAKLVMITAKLA